jgi:hypothetical protein
MRIVIARSARAAMLAGALVLAGSQAAADHHEGKADRGTSGAAGSSTSSASSTGAPATDSAADTQERAAPAGSSTSAEQTGTDPKRSGAMGAASTEQQQRSAPSAGASGQSDSSEAPGRMTGTPHTRSGSDTASATAAPGGEVTGRVDDLDRAANTFTISGLSVKFDSGTEVTKDGQRASPAEIKEGDQVRASFSGSGTDRTAQRIEVMSSGTSAPGLSGSGTGTGQQPAGRGGRMGPGTGTGQGDTSGTTTGTGTASPGGAPETGSGK